MKKRPEICSPPCSPNHPAITRLLCCDALTAGYGGHAVLRGVSVDVRAGELTALIGPNGSGKSTLLRCLSGEMRPIGGQVLLEGEPLAEISAKARARRVAVLPQRPSLPAAHGISAMELVLLGRYPRLGWHGLASRQDERTAREALQAVDALHLAERPLPELSGGELQRVFLARALAQEADILFLDEPASAMDPAHQAELFAQLGILARGGAAILAVMHDVNAAALFCDRVVALRRGEIWFDQTPDLMTSQQLSTLYGTSLYALEHPINGMPQFCLAGHVRRSENTVDIF